VGAVHSIIRVGHDREDTAGYVRFAPKADK
jgi:hypothetical protein